MVGKMCTLNEVNIYILLFTIKYNRPFNLFSQISMSKGNIKRPLTTLKSRFCLFVKVVLKVVSIDAQHFNTLIYSMLHLKLFSM